MHITKTNIFVISQVLFKNDVKLVLKRIFTFCCSHFYVEYTQCWI